MRSAIFCRACRPITSERKLLNINQLLSSAQERTLELATFSLNITRLQIHGARVTCITTRACVRRSGVPRGPSVFQDLIFLVAVVQAVSARPMPAQAVSSRRRCRPTECQAVPGGPMFRNECFKYRTNLRSQPLGSCFRDQNFVPRRFGGPHRSPSLQFAVRNGLFRN